MTRGGSAATALSTTALSKTTDLSTGPESRAATLPPATALRSADLGRLHSAWARAVRGTGQVVLLSGESGIGKTTVLDVVAAGITRGGGIVLRASCPPEVVIPYAAVAQLLDGAAPHLDAAALHRYASAGLISTTIADRLKSPPPTPAGRDELHEAMARLLTDTAAKAPTLVIVDSADEIDRGSVRVLARLVRRATRRPLMIVIACSGANLGRTHALRPLFDAFDDSVAHDHLTLGEIPLSALVHAINDGALARHLWRHAGGNPLVLAELIRHVPRGDAVADLYAMPWSFDEALGRRLDTLGPIVGRFLDIAAVIGPEFTLGAVAAAEVLPGHRITAAAKTAESAGMIAGTADSHRFTHDRVRRVVMDRIGPQTSVRLHLEVAKCLARLSPSDDPHVWARAAFHAAAGAPLGHSGSASRRQAEAGERCMSLFAFDEAANYFGRALALLPGGGTEATAARRRLLSCLSEAHAGAGDSARARQARVEIARDRPTVSAPAP